MLHLRQYSVIHSYTSVKCSQNSWPFLKPFLCTARAHINIPSPICGPSPVHRRTSPSYETAMNQVRTYSNRFIKIRGAHDRLITSTCLLIPAVLYDEPSGEPIRNNRFDPPLAHRIYLAKVTEGIAFYYMIYSHCRHCCQAMYQIPQKFVILFVGSCISMIMN